MSSFKKTISSLKWNRYISYVLVSVFLVVTLIISDKLRMPENRIYLVLFENIAIAIMLSVSLSFVVGFLGELSLGHAGFMCIGAYIGGKVASLIEGSFGNTFPTLLIAILVGGAAAAVAGLIIGLPALRLKGDYLAIVTLAFCEIVHTLFRNSSKESFGGAYGLETPRFDRYTLYIIAFVFVMITFAVFQNIIRSKHGRAVTAIRDNEIAARATGINVTRYKLMVFTVSAFFAGVAGVFYSMANYTVQDSTFTYNYSIEILVMVVLCGMGSMNGSMLSAVLITIVNTVLAKYLTGNLAVLQKLIYSVVLVGIVIYRNAPGLQGFREKNTLRMWKERLFRKKDNEHADDAAYWDRVPTKIEMNEILSTDMKVENVSAIREDGDKQ